MDVNYISPATIGDILNLDPHEGQIIDAEDIRSRPDLMQALVDRKNVAYRAVCGGRVVGVSGVIRYDDNPKVGYAWSLFAKDSGKYMHFIRRMAMYVMADMNMEEIHTKCSTDAERRWCSMLGFNYDPERDMYVRTTDHGY